MSIKIDTATRFARAQELRRAIQDPAALVELADQVVMLAPRSCDTLVAFSPEGQLVGAAASALAHDRGRYLALRRASHLAPLAAEERRAWRWMSVEEALDLGPVRPWVLAWAREHGAGGPCAPASTRSLAQVA